jgi:ribonucleoside-diphosphate reductase alpha chain
MKNRLPETRRSVTHKAVIHSAEGRIKFFITVGLYADGRPGEVFITCDETGSTLDGFADCWAIAISMLLQTGTTLDQLVEKFAYQGFEPSGRTDCPEVRRARSVVDYTVRWMEARFKTP